MVSITGFLNESVTSVDKLIMIWNNGSTSLGEKIIYYSLGFITIGLIAIVASVFFILKNYQFLNWASLKKEGVKILLSSLALGFVSYAVIITGWLLVKTVYLLLQLELAPNSQMLYLLSIAYILLAFQTTKVDSNPKTIYPYLKPIIIFSLCNIFVLISLSSLLGMLRMDLGIKEFAFWAGPPFFLYLAYFFSFGQEGRLSKIGSKLTSGWRTTLLVLFSIIFYALFYFF